MNPDDIDFDFGLGILALTLDTPSDEETKAFSPIGAMVVSTDPLGLQLVFRHKGDWTLWEQACDAHRKKVLAEIGEEGSKKVLDMVKRWEGASEDYGVFGAPPGRPNHIDPWHYPIVITLGWRAEITDYGYCKEDGHTTYHSPILPTKMEAIDWIVENIGYYGGFIYKVYYNPQDGLDGIEFDGWVDDYVSSGVWLVMSHPEYDRHTRPLPEKFYNSRTPEVKEAIRKDLIEEYGGAE